MTIFTGTAAGDTLVGTSGNDEIYGLQGDDTLDGGDGNDIIDGGAGADQMSGGDGDDIYYADNPGDVVVETEFAGWDEVRLGGSYLDISTSYVELVTVSYTGGATVIGGSGLTWIDGGSGNDWYEGRGGNDIISSSFGDDHLDGGDGDDELDGGMGNDTMIGGSGDDVFHVQQSGDVVSEAANGGTDTVLLSLSTYTIPANIENVDARTATGPISITGNSLNNYIIMGFGEVSVNAGSGNDTVSYLSNGAVTVDLAVFGANDGAAADDTLSGVENLVGSLNNDVLRGNGSVNILDGSAGADLLVGRNGGDIYYVDDLGDLIVEAAGGGSDEIRIQNIASYALPIEVEKLTNTTDQAFTGYGNGLANTMTGGAVIDTFYGAAGADILIGGGGNDNLFGEGDHDILNGGIGTDVMVGGLGNDTYIVEQSGDVVTEQANEGIDQVQTVLVSYTLVSYVENLTFTGNSDSAVYFIGNGLNNIITVQAGNDTVEGGGGADQLIGNAGDDYLAGDAGEDTIVGGAGVDFLTGGSEGDIFRFGPGDSGLSWDADRITDFTHVADRVDLRDIDANSGTAGDQAFSFIGTAAFSATAGELRYDFDGSDTWLQGDVNGDGTADFEIVMTGNIAPVVSDFML
jgi:Ca2+-binding RTX toxin-like protein